MVLDFFALKKAKRTFTYSKRVDRIHRYEAVLQGKPMNVADLANFPLTQRLQSTEVFWASLERDARQSDVVPAWHEHVVSQRLAARGAGQ